MVYSTKSCNFDGVNEYVTMGNVLGFERTQAFSIACWFKVSSSNCYFVSKATDTPAVIGYGFILDSSNHVQFLLINDDGGAARINVYTTATFGDGTWHHAVVTYNGSSSASGVTIYVDGVSRALTVVSDTLGSKSILNSTAFNVNGRTNGSFTCTGNLDEVAVWDRELTPAEVLRAYNIGFTCDLSPLHPVSWWRMGDNDTFPTLLDHGSGGNDGTMTNMESGDISNDVPPPGRSLAFDGVNEYVTMGNVLDTNGADSFTISAWVKTTTTSGSYVVSKMDSVPKGYGLLLNTSGQVEFFLFYDATFRAYARGGTAVNDGVWHHIVATTDGSRTAGGLQIYVDGVAETMTTITDTLGSNSISNTGSFNIASRTDGATLLNGKVTEVSVWGVEMTPQAVRDLFNGGNPPDCLNLFGASPFGYWSVNLGAYPALPDLSVYGNNGTCTNTESTDVVRDFPFVNLDEASIPWSQFSCVFGGTDEYVTMGNVYGFERTDTFSLSCWFKTLAPSTYNYLISKLPSSLIGYGMSVTSSGTIMFGLLGSSTLKDEIATIATFHDGQWHHVVATNAGTGISGMHLYVDGILQATTNVTNTLGTNTILNTGPFELAVRSSGTWPLVGSLDEVAVHDSELSPGEVFALYNGGAPPDLSQSNTSGNLVGWWRMGDGDTFPTLTDHGSGGNDGTMTNMEATDVVADVPTGKFSLLFDGVNEWVTMGDVLGFERTDPFSLSFWMKSAAGGSGYDEIIGKQESSGNFRGWSVQINRTTGSLFFVLRSVLSTNEASIGTTASVTDGTWKHIVCTYDGSSSISGMAIYINGSLAATSTLYNTLTTSLVNSTPFGFGSLNGVGDWYTGSLDEVAIYDVELTAGEALEVYNGGNPIDVRKMASWANIVGYWRMGDGDIYPYISDRSSNGNDGTMTNMEVTDIVNDAAFLRIQAGVPLLPQVSGYSVAFDGVNEYVSLGDVFAFEWSDTFSVSVWFKSGASVDSEFLVSKQIGGTPEGWQVWLADTGALGFAFTRTWDTNVLMVRTLRGIYRDNVWHHVVYTYDGSGAASGVTIYVDGISESLETLYDTLSGSIVSTADLRFGTRQNGYPNQCFSGNLSNIAFYSIELSAADAARIYNNGLPCDLTRLNSYANLLSWWKLGEGDSYPVLTDSSRGKQSFPTLIDSSGNGYRGTATNMEAADVVWDSPGGKSVVFGGTDEYVTMGNVLGFDRFDPFSLSCWVKLSTTGITAVLMGKDSNLGYLLFQGDDNKLRFLMRTSGASTNQIHVRSVDTTIWRNGEWHHICCTYDGSSTASGVTFYMDGSVMTTEIEQDTLVSSIANSAVFALGALVSYSTFYYVGSMDEAAVWDKELSSDEVAWVYNNGLPRDLAGDGAPSNLVGWWPMGEGGVFPTLTDWSTNGNDGTMTNMEVTDIQDDSPGPVMCVFDGVNEYVSVGNYLDFERTDTFSVSVWVKWTATGWNTIVSKILDSPSYRGWRLVQDGSAPGQLMFTLVNYVTTNHLAVRTNASFNDGQWHHVVCTYDGSSTPGGIVIYVDSVQQATTTTDNTLSATISNAAYLCIGASQGSPWAYNWWAGSIDEVSIWDKTLSLAEVLEIYNQGKPPDLRQLGFALNLVGWWRMGGSGDTFPTITDRSLGGHNGTMTNMEVTDLQKSPLADRLSIRSYNFGGTNEYVTMGDVSALNFERTDTFSVSAWFKTTTTTNWEFLVGKELGAATYQGWGLKKEGSGGTAGAIRLDLVGSAGTSQLAVRTPSALNDGAWHHILATYDGSSSASGVHLYVDGVLVSGVTVNNNLTTSIQTSAPATIGAMNAALDFIVGTIAETSIWDKELSALEAADVYNMGHPTDLATLSTASDLVAWWRMGNLVTFPGTMINMEGSDLEREVPLAGATIQFVQGSERDIGKPSDVTANQSVGLRDAKGPGAESWQWELLANPALMAVPPIVTEDETRQASVTPVADGTYIVKVTRTDIGYGETTDMQGMVVFNGEIQALPSAGLDRNLLKVSEAAMVASWIGRADAQTNVFFDAYVRWLKDSLKNAQTIQIVSGRQQKDATSFEGIGAVRLNSTNFPTYTTAVFQAVLEVSSGHTAECHLYNLTDGYIVAGSSLSTTSTVAEVVEGTITVPSGQKDYEARLRITGGGGFATCTGARIILR